MLQRNRIRSALDERGVAFGSWCQINSPEIAELTARSGIDFCIVDMEHGSFGIESAASMVRAVEAGGASSVVRVPDATRTNIFKVLDAGASGVMIPNVEDAQTVSAVVEAARFAPTGRRGACPCVRATAHGVDDWQDYVAWSADNVVVAILVETARGLENYDEIIAAPGLSMVAMGPFDLSMALGYNGNWKHPEVRRKQEEMVRKARARGLDVMASTFDSDPEDLSRQVESWKELGVRLFAVSGDRFMLSSGYKAIVSRLHATDVRR